jgi:predicted ribosomally synthesized peptide with SipW-like signal peptide
MARHAARRRWFGQGRTRALLTLGVVFGLAIGGTSAYWTDSSVVATGRITSGSMDLQLAQSTDGPWGALGTGTAYAASHITISNLTPAEAYAFPLAVRNVGNADLTYAATVTQGASPAWGFVNSPLTVQLFTGAPNTSDTTYPIQHSCGGSPLAPAATVGTGATPVIAPARRLSAGTTEVPLCVLVAMVPSADNANQGRQGQLRLDFTASQVTS